ncbi:MAG TPA: hypothetical protein VJV03_20000 [Pyrinomonadaceae bacterium]|nr:hypothetical protein [Pyrinomonadaceae bacterium]
MDSRSLPVACNLMDSEFQERRRSVLQKVISAVAEVKETENGFSYRFPSDGAWIKELATVVELEHQCCPFLRFSITVEAGDGPIWLEMSGPEGTKEFLTEVFN